jgi:hypothetical protein
MIVPFQYIHIILRIKKEKLSYDMENIFSLQVPGMDYYEDASFNCNTHKPNERQNLSIQSNLHASVIPPVALLSRLIHH